MSADASAMTVTWEVRAGDCVEAMAAMDECSVDAICTDPPYLLNFMGRAFDSQDGAHGDPKRMQEWHEAWATEALRVLKPGGFLLAFGGTRTYHRLACAVEDAGFEIRDTIAYMYGSGFPKSLDVGKAIDKAAGAEREVLGPNRYDARRSGTDLGRMNDDGWEPGPRIDTAPATPEAERWQGWGTALKPAHEPIVVARKPLTGTVAANVLEHGTGALNVDGCRVGTGDDRADGGPRPNRAGGPDWRMSEAGNRPEGGRWPANVVLSHDEDCVQVGARRVVTGTAVGRNRDPELVSNEVYGARAKDTSVSGYADEDGLETVEQWACVPGCPVRALDEQTGELHSQDPSTRRSRSTAQGVTQMGTGQSVEYADHGGASRFFYCAKASRAERGAANNHPTVKPVALMRWLVRLVTPPGGTVLDPFAGSGTTAIAALREGFTFIGIEREASYCDIARSRIRDDQPMFNVPAEVAA